jgi:hypothetical protein
MQGLLALLAGHAWRLLPAPALRAGVELLGLADHAREEAPSAGIRRPPELPRAVEDALQRGVPVYFVAEASCCAAAGTGATNAWPGCSAPGGWPTSR